MIESTRNHHPEKFQAKNEYSLRDDGSLVDIPLPPTPGCEMSKGLS